MGVQCPRFSQANTKIGLIPRGNDTSLQPFAVVITQRQ